MNALDVYYLIAMGVGLFVLEMFVYTFFFFWMGAGFIIVAFLTLLVPFESGLTQMALALTVGVILMFAFRKKMVRFASKGQTTQEEHAHTSGPAVIEKGHIKFDGTYWKCHEDLSGYPEGTRIEVSIKDNVASIVRVI